MGAPEIEHFLTDLAANGHVAASTQNQAFHALLFLYQQVLGIELPRLDALRARRPKRLQESPARWTCWVRWRRRTCRPLWRQRTGSLGHDAAQRCRPWLALYDNSALHGSPSAW